MNQAFIRSVSGASSAEPALELRKLTKSFGAIEIIRSVDLVVRRGERHALIGPNGAGKSTLFNLISGHYAPTSGEILLDGESIGGLPPHLINRRGLSRSFQITNLFPRMTVAQNLRIAVMGHHGHRLTLFRRISALKAVKAEVDQFLQQLRLTHRRDDLAGDLAYSEQRVLEIGMALAADPSVLILDEPTAGMSREETAYIVDIIRTVTAMRTLVVVEHDMSVVFALADRISVLVYGQIIATGDPAAVRADRKVQEAYLGEDIAA